MVLHYRRSIQVFFPHDFIPTTEKEIKSRSYRIYRHKTGSCSKSVNYGRSKIPFTCSGNKLEIFKYTPIEQTICIDAYQFRLSKNGIAWQYCISLGKQNYNDIRTPLDFRHKNDFKITTLLQRQQKVGNPTSKTQRCNNVSFSLQ